MNGLFDIWGMGMIPPDKRKEWFNKGTDYLLGEKDVVGGKTMDTRSGGLTSKIKNFDYSFPGSDFDRKWAEKQAQKQNPNIGNIQNQNIKPAHLGDTGGSMDHIQDPKWWEKLAGMAGVDPAKAMAHWKDKGGFEGLMANPAFTLGLAFMQAGAEGKT